MGIWKNGNLSISKGGSRDPKYPKLQSSFRHFFPPSLPSANFLSGNGWFFHPASGCRFCFVFRGKLPGRFNQGHMPKNSMVVIINSDYWATTAQSWWSFCGGQGGLWNSRCFGLQRTILLGQWLNFKLFGITYLVGKIKFKLLFQGSIR